MEKYFKLFIALLLAVCLAGCNIQFTQEGNRLSQEVTSETAHTETQTMKVSYIDVGQGDAILLEVGEAVMLIDGGDNKTEEELVSYLNDKGITKIDYLIGTHPHADHIGGLDKVINAFEIGKIYMPKVAHTSKTFEKVLLAAKNKNYKISTAKQGEAFTLGEQVQVEILSPIQEKYKELNNYSIVIRVLNGKDRFLFMGDAEALVEEELLEENIDLTADVLKIGHHGSSSSSSQDFIKAIAPTYGMIFSGKDNSYGHPHKETLETLAKFGVSCYNTQDLGTITVTSIGQGKLEIETER